MRELSVGIGLIQLSSGGFGSWNRIAILANSIADTLGTRMDIAAIYDRDYYCDEEIGDVLSELSKKLNFAHVHDRKEIENYLLVPEALDRALLKAVAERMPRGEDAISYIPPSIDVLVEITNPMKDSIQAQLIAKRTKYLRSSSRDSSETTLAVLSQFAPRWDNIYTRLCIVPGKDVLRSYRRKIQEEFGVSLSNSRIIESMHKEEIPNQLIQLLEIIDTFRKKNH